MSSSLLPLIVLCLIVGSALDTSNLCVVRAARDLSLGRPAIAVGCLLTAAVAALVFYGNTRLGWHRVTPPWAYPTALTLFGSSIFAFGALVNGACAMGTVGRLARGDIGYVATLAGGLAATLLLQPVDLPSQLPDHVAAGGLPWLLLVLIVVLSAVILTRRHLDPARMASYAVLGLVAAVVTNWQGAWTWLSLAGALRSGLPFDYLALGCVIAVIAGATLTSLFRHRFHFVRPSPGVMLREAAGGVMMATGAVFIPGGNDSLLVYGLPSGSPHALGGYLLMFVLMLVTMRTAPIFRRWVNWPSSAA